MKKNIVLCGFMGSGKSTVGKALSCALEFPLYDSDKEIEIKENMKISEIFGLKGEQYFRTAESETIKHLSIKENIIIATGGGAVLNPENTENLKRTGIIVFLDVTAKTVVKRLEGDLTRPLLMREDKETAVNELLNYRKPIYESVCDIKIDANGDYKDIVKKIVEFYKKIS